MMAKEKFRTKRKKGKKLLTPQQKKDTMSHKNQCTQLWKAEKMDETMSLWKQNDNLPPDQRLSMRTIAKKVGIGKTTIIERLSGRCQGQGHIAGAKRKAQILIKGKQVTLSILTVFWGIPVSIETTQQSRDYVKWTDMWVNNSYIINVYFIFQEETYSTFQKVTRTTNTLSTNIL